MTEVWQVDTAGQHERQPLGRITISDTGKLSFESLDSERPKHFQQWMTKGTFCAARRGDPEIADTDEKWFELIRVSLGFSTCHDIYLITERGAEDRQGVRLDRESREGTSPDAP
ncbi:MAG TPA: hypothetical protein QGG47_10160 [Acidobacteriota bacterium]|nr:hypothetical protein [Acidobacteriota bacterium]